MSSEEKLKAYEIIDAVSNHYDADIYLYSGEISNGGFGKLIKEIAIGPERKNCFLILVTGGGLANSAYQIARVLQKTYDRLIVFTPSYCKSAGTLIALGAHILVMDQFSELGPLDVQLVRTDELTGRRSGLVTKSAFESLSDQSFELFENFMLRLILQSRGTVSFKTAAEISASISSNLMSEVYKQIGPELVGNDYRDLTVAVEYGDRLARVSGNPKASTVEKLVHNYPSHDFIIDEDEARELFEDIEPPVDEVYELIGLIGDPIYQEAQPVIVRRIRRPPPSSNPSGSGAVTDEVAEQDANGEENGTEQIDDTDTAVDEGREGNRRIDQNETN